MPTGISYLVTAHGSYHEATRPRQTARDWAIRLTKAIALGLGPAGGSLNDERPGLTYSRANVVLLQLGSRVRDVTGSCSTGAPSSYTLTVLLEVLICPLDKLIVPNTLIDIQLKMLMCRL